MSYYKPYWLNEDELEHFGTKGMKWGIRRYQNADGTLTEAGKKRYSSAVVSAFKSSAAKVMGSVRFGSATPYLAKPTDSQKKVAANRYNERNGYEFPGDIKTIKNTSTHKESIRAIPFGSSDAKNMLKNTSFYPRLGEVRYDYKSRTAKGVVADYEAGTILSYSYYMANESDDEIKKTVEEFVAKQTILNGQYAIKTAMKNVTSKKMSELKSNTSSNLLKKGQNVIKKTLNAAKSLAAKIVNKINIFQK